MARLSDTRLSSMLERLDTDDATDLLINIPAERQQVLLERASPEVRRDVEELLSYPQDSAGGIMKTEVASCTAATTVREATEYLRRNADQFHDVHNVFVTDAKNRLLGQVGIRRLLLADENTPLLRLMDTDITSVEVGVDQEEVAVLFEKYDLLSLPVVDASNRLAGRITIDDIVDVITEEATEDIMNLAGMAPESLAPTSRLEPIRSRLPWLALNLLTATLSAATVSLFEDTIQHIAIAAGLMTIVASQGGNAGIQTMTVVVRGLALGELQPAQAWRVLGNELVTALVNGVALGAVAGTISYLWRGNAWLSLVLGFSLVATLQVSAIVGSLVPLGLKRLGVDPAVGSSVLVTATLDIFGFFFFLGLLTMML